ncbi:RdgB/HAM1 family non-canonical purine NTP pyrophosphatase [Pseudolysinimonas sp.]|uniref:RdgB/HAM1 family non-canonical purine NTP pyrophosphatase n=1 Tax=Pseudolysinimonas sp. TaxID=2680009 RepID=UPI003F821D11
MTTFVLATHNPGKVAELRRLLGERLGPHELIGYDGPAPEEDGATFEANALIKARAAFATTGLPSIADDSGIAVRALGGAPGIHSAYYSGSREADANNAALLRVMAGEEDRAAEFVCVAALVDDGLELTERGAWPGRVLTAPAGEHGHGYDPVFQGEGDARSAAELTLDEKNEVSHRARAFGRLVVELRRRYG